jgi:hypothetical protein
MFQASSPTIDGGHLILLGLTPGNVRRAEAGEPILVDCAALGVPGVRVSIVFGQTERDIVAELRATGVRFAAGDEAVNENLNAVEREHRAKGTTP